MLDEDRFSPAACAACKAMQYRRARSPCSILDVLCECVPVSSMCERCILGMCNICDTQYVRVLLLLLIECAMATTKTTTPTTTTVRCPRRRRRHLSSLSLDARRCYCALNAGAVAVKQSFCCGITGAAAFVVFFLMLTRRMHWCASYLTLSFFCSPCVLVYKLFP